MTDYYFGLAALVVCAMQWSACAGSVGMEGHTNLCTCTPFNLTHALAHHTNDHTTNLHAQVLKPPATCDLCKLAHHTHTHIHTHTYKHILKH